MATVLEKVEQFAKMEHIMPQDAQGIGCLYGQNGLILLGFKTEREIITEVGYLAAEPKLSILHACLNIICHLMKGKATVNANLPQREEIARLLSDNGELSDEDQSYAVMAELALKYAVRDYSARCS